MKLHYTIRLSEEEKKRVTELLIEAKILLSNYVDPRILTKGTMLSILMDAGLDKIKEAEKDSTDLKPENSPKKAKKRIKRRLKKKHY